MILRRLVVENFRQFSGTSEIDFAPPGDRSVTVLLGENGAGKTTLLNSILWCLYGRVDLENPDEILSYSASAEAAVGSEIPVAVSLTFTHGDTRYVATRRASYRKHDGGRMVQEVAPELRIDQIPPSGEQSVVDDPKRAIGQLLPQALSKFFFFRGEEMESLALQASAATLKEGVERFFDFTLLDSAMHHLWQVKADYENEINRVAVGEVKVLSDRILSLEQDESELSDQITQFEANIQSLGRQKDEIDQALEAIEETRPYLEQKALLDERIDRLEDDRKERISDVKAVMSRDAFLWPISDVLDEPEQLAEGAVQRGELPARIKPAFVDDRIALGECICGTNIDEAMREHLVEWKGATGLAGIEDAVAQCRGAIAEFRLRREESLNAFSERRKKLAATEEEIKGAIGERSKVETELEGRDFGLEYVRELQEKRRSLEDDFVATRVEKGRKADELAKKVEDREDLNARRKELAKGIDQIETLQKRVDSVDKVRSAIATMRTERSSLIREYLNKELRENWTRIAQLERLVEIREDFALSIKERGGDAEWVTSAPSSANLKALFLSFVSALITLAKQVGGEEREPGLKIFGGGDFPLMMDAPFAKMGTYFKQTIPPRLKESVPQIILMTSDDHWQGEIAAGLGSAVGRAYVLELHRPGESDESSYVRFGDSDVDYVVAESGIEYDWSVAKEV